MARKQTVKNPEEPGILWVMMVGSLVNGVTLPAFEGAEIYPGEPIQVRGEGGINFDHATKLVASERFVWCDENGSPINPGEEPEPTEDEAATVKKSGAGVMQGSRTGIYPEFHKVDTAYTGPQEVGAVGEEPMDPEIIEVPAPRPSLNVKANSARREEPLDLSSNAEHSAGFGETGDTDGDTLAPETPAA